MIVIRRDASALESLAANEVQRYVYLRSGRLLRVDREVWPCARIVVSCKNRELSGEVGQGLAPQQFRIKTVPDQAGQVWWIVGGDDIGTLYGAYRFAEKLGVRFGLDGDVLPDERLTAAWPVINETGKPRFALRGLEPFHDFSTGPDWWNAQDYQSVLCQMAKLRLNFIGLHTYPSWNPAAGPEANVWIGLPEDVDAQGDVKFGYEAGMVTTRRGWAVKPFPTSRYASGAGLLFENDDYGPDFLLDCLDWPKTDAAATAMFNRYGDVQKAVFGQARRLGIKTCVGTEIPLGVPKALASRLEAKGMKPDDQSVIRQLYEGTFLRLQRKLPVDYYWLWAPEVWLSMEPGCANWEMTSRANTERDLAQAEAAAKSVQPPFGFATCGWRLGTRDDPLWMDKRTPPNWAASSINTSLGGDPVEKSYGTMTNRPRWVIGWAEDDNTAGAHCCTTWDLQLCVERMFLNSSQAFGYGCDGMMAIHWRTAAISPNIEALARAGWAFDRAPENHTSKSGEAQVQEPESDQSLVASVPASKGMNAHWADWGRAMFGGDAGAQAGRAMQKLDGSHPRINGLIQGGAKTTDDHIATLFAPLCEMRSLRSRITGAGNLERLDYWLNLIHASELRVWTWVLSDRLAAKMKEVNSIQDAEPKRRFVREKILPLRLEVARSYEDLIAAFVTCARSPGEVGTISSIEAGCRARIVTAHDKAIETLLGEPLPAAAAINSAYRGAPRIFVSGNCTLRNANEPQEIRAFVLSAPKCSAVNLCWRRLGNGAFKKVPATHRARQAYRVALPAESLQTLEYYLEAALEDGTRVLWPATAPSTGQTVAAW